MNTSDVASALRALKAGDLSVRLTPSAGVPTETADVFNDLMSQMELMHAELTRLCTEIGDQGYFGGQAEVPGLAGAWASLIKDQNRMSATLTDQIRSIAKVASAKASGQSNVRTSVPAVGETKELIDALNSIGDEPEAVASGR